MSKQTPKYHLQSDALFKKILTQEEPAKEFLKEYLPEELKKLIKLDHVDVKSDSYITDDLKKTFSDIVYQLKTSSDEDAFVYVLLEHQSKPDPLMALRLWEYMIGLAKRHVTETKSKKIPLIYPIVFYNGAANYTAAKNLWDLFDNPTLAREVLTSDYKLIDLHSMSDDEIKQKKHLALLEYMMKYIHMRDTLKLWRSLFKDLKAHIEVDRSLGFVYLKSFVWYTDSKLDRIREQELAELINQSLSPEDGEKLMPTIAEHYMEKGNAKGLKQGIEQNREENALRMLERDLDIKLVADITGLSLSKLKALQKTIH